MARNTKTADMPDNFTNKPLVFIKKHNTMYKGISKTPAMVSFLRETSRPPSIYAKLFHRFSTISILTYIYILS
jgi:hypothetical protein